MPIPVVCGNCQTRLNAPDAAAGKKVKCPKCQTVMAVPGAAAPPPPAADTPFDFNDDPQPRRTGGESPPARPAPESPPPPPPAAGAAFDFGAAVSSASEPKGRGDRPRREDDDRPRRRDDDDRPRRPRPRDEDAEDDDRPRGRRPDGGKKKSMLPLLLLGGGLLVLVCCGGGGFGVYLAVGKVKETAEKLKAENDAKEKQIADEKKRRAGDTVGGDGGPALAPGWTKFDAPDKSFRASFPATPGDGGLTYQTPAVQSAKSYESLESDGSVVCTLGVLKFRPNSKAADRERDLKAAAELMRIAADTVAQPRAVDWLGGQAKEAVSASNLQQGVTYTTRWVLVGNTGYIAQVQHKSKPDAAAKFFSSVEPLSK